MSSYASDGAFRAALEDRLKAQAAARGVALPRLQRRVTTERLLARFVAEHPGRWVLKGGAALDLRLGDAARATKDVDLGLRLAPPDGDTAIEMLSDVVAHDANDRFRFSLARVVVIDEQDVGDVRRATVDAHLAGRLWGTVKVDIGIRSHELDDTEVIDLPGTLIFAGIGAPAIETISLPRHVAEKLHGMMRSFGDRENTRTRDLIDVVLLLDRGLIDIDRSAAAIRTVFAERRTDLPPALHALPTSWQAVYERNAEEHDIHPRSFPEAVAVVSALWDSLISRQETT